MEENGLKTLLKIAMVTVVTLVMTGCSSQKESTTKSTSGNYPVTVKSYSISSDGSSWSLIDATFDQAPQRVVCNNQGIAELMIRLGLTDRIIGVAAVFGEPAEDVTNDFKALPVISQSYASKELVLSVNPDLVIGRGDLFVNGDYGVGTVEDLKGIGISTYVSHVGEDKATYQSFIADIENIGKIFDVQDKAKQLIAKYDNKIKDIQERWSDKRVTMAQIAVVKDGVPTISNPANQDFQNDAFKMIGVENIFKEYKGSEISVENLIESNPDILVLFDYIGGPNMEMMIKELYGNNILQNITAIKNKKIIALDFNKIFGGGSDIYDAMDELANQIYN